MLDETCSTSEQLKSEIIDNWIKTVREFERDLKEVRTLTMEINGEFHNLPIDFNSKVSISLFGHPKSYGLEKHLHLRTIEVSNLSFHCTYTLENSDFQFTVCHLKEWPLPDEIKNSELFKLTIRNEINKNIPVEYRNLILKEDL